MDSETEGSNDSASFIRCSTASGDRIVAAPLNSDVTEDFDEDGHEIYLSFVWQQNKLGAAFYDASSSILYVSSDYPEAQDFVYTRMLMQQACPNIIITMAKMDLRLNSFLRGLTDGRDNTDEDSSNNSYTANESSSGKDGSFRSTNITDSESFSFPENIRIDMLPNQDFSYSSAKQRIHLLNFPGMPENMTEEEKALYFSSLFPFDAVNAVRACGALLKYLNQRRIGVELEIHTTSTPLLLVKHFVLDQVMMINRDAFLGLQIFCPLSHPSVYKAAFRNANKEGFSLRYHLQSKCLSYVGRKNMSLWLLRPLQNLNLINERLQNVGFFSKPSSQDLVDGLSSCIKRIRDIRRVVFKMANAMITVSEWKSFRENLRACCELVEIARRNSKKSGILDRLISSDEDIGDGSGGTKLRRLAESCTLINKVIDFESSAEQNKCVVHQYVDENLDEKRNTLTEAIKISLNNIAEIESVELMNYYPGEINLVYEPNMGCFVTILQKDLQHHLGTDDSPEIPGYELSFIQYETMYFKTQRTSELYDEIRKSQEVINEIETNLLTSLQNAMLSIVDTIFFVTEIAAQIDCFLAFATCVKELNYCRPEVNEGFQLKISHGRHPLQELNCKEAFIANDTALCEENGPRVLVISGPNSSGKSVYLKQVALIVYMAHLGSFVPAESASIGLCDRIYCRMKSSDSITTGLSAFSSDTNQVIPALLNSTKRSLVLLDEYGKGTYTTDGTAILAAVVNFWIRLAENCPKVLVATHLLDVIKEELNLIYRSPLVRFMKSDISRPSGGNLVFLYKLVDGAAKCSMAQLICEKGNMPVTVVGRAAEITEYYMALKPIPKRPVSNEIFKLSEKINSEFAEIDMNDDKAINEFLEHVRSASALMKQLLSW